MGGWVEGWGRVVPTGRLDWIGRRKLTYDMRRDAATDDSSFVSFVDIFVRGWDASGTRSCHGSRILDRCRMNGGVG